jgi:hypothetical protein
MGIGTGLAALLLTLNACDPAAITNNASADGRMRLSANNSNGEFGQYVVHVNAMTASSLTPEVAQNYGITRSENRGLVTVVILKKSSDMAAAQPVLSDVEVTAANLTGQLKPVELREIIDGDSIYYIGLVRVDNRETINFDIDIRPNDSSRKLPIRFSHQFYTR